MHLLGLLHLPNLLYLYAWLFPGHGTPASCVSTSRDLVSLVQCLDAFTIPPGYYTQESYMDSQPSSSERRAWVDLVSALLSVDGNCTTLVPPPELESSYTIQRFTTVDTNRTYCVLAEDSVDCEGYPRGWGHVVVPESRSQVSRDIHISAPHPKFDRGTIEQAAALFEMSGARSLLLAGRTRQAFAEPSNCIMTLSKPYYRTDPAHSPEEPFFDAFTAIYEWQKSHGGCPSSSCAFVQLHGKGPSTCARDQVFLSTGLRNNTWYTDPVEYPIKRLKQHLQGAFPAWNVSLPSDSRCTLTASGNVGGRYINGVSRPDICSTPADPSNVKGEFIHIEQAIASRGSDSYRRWARALKQTFETRCSTGMEQHPKTLLCVSRSVAEEARAWPWDAADSGPRRMLSLLLSLLPRRRG